MCAWARRWRRLVDNLVPKHRSQSCFQSPPSCSSNKTTESFRGPHDHLLSASIPVLPSNILELPESSSSRHFYNTDKSHIRWVNLLQGSAEGHRSATANCPDADVCLEESSGFSRPSRQLPENSSVLFCTGIASNVAHLCPKGMSPLFPLRNASSQSLRFFRTFASSAASLQQEAAKVAENIQAEAVLTNPPVGPREWSPGSKRTGVIAVKCGMISVWDKWGVRIPLTVLWVDDNQVVQVKTEEKEGYSALQIGYGQTKAKQLTKPELGHFAAAGVPLKRKLAEFRVSSDALLPVGTPLTVRHFVPGQYVDIIGTTIGKGFQGVMKRWNFSGGPASHGNSLAHRVAGSTGGRQDPGKVFKGKKMPGQMGNKQRTLQNAWVYKIEPERNLLYVRGQVPGHKGNFVLVKDAFWKKLDTATIPFPTDFVSIETDPSAAEPVIVDLGDDDPLLAE